MSAVWPEEFQPVFRYMVRDGMAHEQENLPSDLWEQMGVVYARVFDGQVVYIGSTHRQLGKRIREHVRLVAARKDPAYSDWAEGKRVTIVAFKPAPVELLGRVIPIHRAVEAALIAEFHPRFVKRAP